MRELSRRVIDSATHADQKEKAGLYQAGAAIYESMVGNAVLAKLPAQAALGLSNGRDVAGNSTMALALAGDSAYATRLADDLAKRFPEDMLAQSGYLPMIRGRTAFETGNGTKAIEALASAAPYEFSDRFRGYPAYLRGQAYLKLGQGSAATTEFQKIVDHPGVVQNDPVGALTHLDLARAYALSGDTQRARTAYQDFLTLWKDADPDIPSTSKQKLSRRSCSSTARALTDIHPPPTPSLPQALARNTRRSATRSYRTQ